MKALMMEIFGRLRNCFLLVSRLPKGSRRTTISHPPKFRIMALLDARAARENGPVVDIGDCDSWLIASLLYVHVVLCNGYEVTDDEELRETVDGLMQQLQDALMREYPLVFAKRYPPRVLIWALLIGGINARGEAQSDLFQKSIAGTCKALGLTSWQHVKIYLQELPWVQRDVEELYKAFWMKAVAQFAPNMVPIRVSPTPSSSSSSSSTSKGA